MGTYCEYGLILTDLSMPIIDGYKLAQRCRRELKLIDRSN